MSNRQARIRRLKAAFQKAEELMKAGYVVQWDGEVVTRFDWSNGLDLEHSVGCYSGVYDDVGTYEDLADLKIEEINEELKARLTVSKRVEIKL